MGGRGRGKTRREKAAARMYERKEKPDSADVEQPTRVNYELAKQENAQFVKYYTEQNILDDEEFNLFFAKLKEPLPTSFRFTGSRANTTELIQHMVNTYFPDLRDVSMVIDNVDTKVPLPEPISWFPNSAGWRWATPKRQLKKLPNLMKFHQFLHAETEMGNISRQEEVSMIPCNFLDVQSNHAVLDMCAAPGSKTAQLVEAVQSDESVIPSGFVIANDADYKRSHMLVKQVKRLSSPCILVTNHEAQSFPNIYITPKNAPVREALQFDRILCDVPCSGDGTFRKNNGIWKTWHQNSANALHRLQVMIIMRACELLKVGGRLVYSTCSFNPVENEAVILECMRQTNGSVKVLDVSQELPSLKRKQGMKKWKVAAKTRIMYEKWEDVPVKDRDGEKRVRESMFCDEEMAEKVGLERCMRVYPHLQDTGGFFVTVLEKTAAYGPIDAFLSGNASADALDELNPPSPKDPVAESEEGKSENSNKGIKRESEDEEGNKKVSKRSKLSDAVPSTEASEESLIKLKSSEMDVDTTEDKKQSLKNSNLKVAWKGREKPFYFVENDPEINGFCNLYGLSSSFPRNQLVVRTDTDKHQTVYFVNDGVKKVINAHNSFRLNIVNTGVKLFSRHNNSDAGSPFRLNASGLGTFAPHLSDERILDIPLTDFLMVVRYNNPLFKSLSVPTQDWLNALKHQGSCLFRYRPTDEEKAKGFIHTAILPIWRAQVSVSLLMDKVTRQAWLQRILGGDYDPVVEEKRMKEDMKKIVGKGFQQKSESQITEEQTEENVAE